MENLLGETRCTMGNAKMVNKNFDKNVMEHPENVAYGIYLNKGAELIKFFNTSNTALIRRQHLFESCMQQRITLSKWYYHFQY